MKGARIVSSLVFLALVSVWSLAPPRALAAGGAAAQLDVRLIYATKGKPYVDPALRDLARYFGRFGGFNSFKAAGRSRLTVRLNQTARVNLPGGRVLKLTYRGTKGGFVHVSFELPSMKMLVRIRDGGLFFHMGVRHKQGRVVIAIRARTAR